MLLQVPTRSWLPVPVRLAPLELPLPEQALPLPVLPAF